MSKQNVWRCVIISCIVFWSLVGFGISKAFAAPTLEEVVTSPETFALCKTADVVSTIYLLERGLATEANPLVAWSMGVGGYVPLIVVGVGLWWLMDRYQDVPGAKTGIGLANAVTCTVAVKNLMLIP